jgi:hypothetical protein
MYQFIILIITVLFATSGVAKNSYQIDLIVFVNPQNNVISNTFNNNSPFIPLKPEASYKFLPASQSQLRNEYYLLSRKAHYQVLGHYSWQQTSSNQNAMTLQRQSQKGWEMQGTVHIQRQNYYLLNAELQFSSPSNPQSSFTVTQNQRLKPEVVYYLDHDQIGMLVKVHQIA